LKKDKNIIIFIFIIMFCISYMIVGYVLNEMFVVIDWVDDVTIWQKLREYYTRNMSRNFFPSILLAALLTPAVSKVIKIKRN